MHEFGWAIGVAIIVLAVSLGRTFRSLGRSFADRRASTQGGETPDLALRAEVDEMRQRLVELEERVDFAERLLAKRHEAERLGPSR
jgi:tetrahydromethanopterin S-methyltransferase subunit G